jgi:hypothetical protein
MNSENIHGLPSKPTHYEFPLTYTVQRRMRWAGHVARMGEKRNAYRILVGKPEGKRPIGKP